MIDLQVDRGGYATASEEVLEIIARALGRTEILNPVFRISSHRYTGLPQTCPVRLK